MTAPLAAKEKPAAPAGDTINDKIRPFLAAAQEAANKKDFASVIVQVDKAVPLAVTPYEKFLCGQFRAIAAQNLKDNVNVARGLDDAIDSGYSSPSLATYAVIAGQNAYNDHNYQKAIDRLTKAQQLGSTESAIAVLIADSYFKMNRTAEGLAYSEKIYAADQAAKRVSSEDSLARPAQAALTAKMPKETLLWLKRLISAYPSSTNWHDLLVIYRDGHPLNAQGILDLYRLMKVSKSFKSQNEVEEYAITALDKRGLPGEAKAAIEDAMVAGDVSKPTSGMMEVKNSASTKSNADHATLANAEKQAQAAATGKIARGTADAYFGYKEYAKAIALYKLAQTKGGVDANLINMGLGESYALSGDKANAQSAFMAVTGDSTELAGLWVLWLNSAK